MKKAILTGVLALCMATPALAGGRYHDDYRYRGHDRGYHGHYVRDRHYDRDYYRHCKRDKGTGGAIAGAIGGGIFGNVVAGRGDKALGTVVGAGAGALIGRELDRGDVKCR
jgi:hypothetical protein